MGELSVLLFFMLTGYLFWSQIKAGNYDGNTFFIKRIRRLAPIMLVIIATYSVLDWIVGRLPIPTAQQLLSLPHNFGFGFGKIAASSGDMNDVFTKDTYLRINTTWTLRWEWLFYPCLPLVAALARFGLVTLFAIAVILLLMDPFQIRAGGTDAVCVLAFWLGALSRSLEGFNGTWPAPLFSRSGSVLALLIGIAATGYYLLGDPELVQMSARVSIMVFTIFPVFVYFVVSKRFPDRLAKSCHRSSLWAKSATPSIYGTWASITSWYASCLSCSNSSDHRRHLPSPAWP
jgi:peptidoglycan/LPS O-acetylase OafA/YrhL